MKQILTVLLLLTWVAVAHSEQRGLKVMTKTPDGDLLELYEGSWAVVIGVNQYEKWPRLQYAVNDAKAVREKLQQLGFPQENIIYLTDGQATKDRIELILGDELRRKMGKNDRVFIYFAGHGQTEDLPGGKQEGYIVPVDGDKSNLFSTCISMTSVRQFSQRMAAKHVFYAIDACYSGLALMRAGELDTKDRQYLRKVARFPARQLVTAGSAGEQVIESGGHGAFTRTLLIALDGSADKYPPFGVLTGSELGNYLQPTVSIETNNEQTPQFGRLAAGEGEFMFVLPEIREQGASQVEVYQGQEAQYDDQIEKLKAEIEAGKKREAEEEAARLEAERKQREAEELQRELEEQRKRQAKKQEQLVRPSVSVSGQEGEMVWIEPGTFVLGSPPWEEGRDGNEGPEDEVTISQGFYLGKYEITQGQWYAVMGSNPSKYKGANHPVEKVSWEEVQQFISKLNQSAGSSVYRLPTEAEWEYACRAGSTTRWSFGDDASMLGEYAWYDGNNSSFGTKDVGTKKPNLWGLYDMHGNVYEWCQDKWGSSYSSGSQIDPLGPTAGSSRVMRGGRFNNSARYVRSAYRDHSSPDYRSDGVGFRLLRIR